MPTTMKEKYDMLSDAKRKEQNEAFIHHNKIMKVLEDAGFKPNPEQKVYPHANLGNEQHVHAYY